MRERHSWGGHRDGAGRPKRRAVASERHVVRPVVSAAFPVRVTCRITAPVNAPTQTAAALEAARRLSLARADFQIVELALRGRAVHLLVHAHDKVALARGMQGFQVAAARALNRALRRSGAVFADRYRLDDAITGARTATLSAARLQGTEARPTPRRRRTHPALPARGTPRRASARDR